MPTIEQTIATALTGGPRRPARVYVVTGTNSRGERFTTSTGLGAYDTHAAAAEFAREVNDNGGDTRVERRTSTR